MSDEEQITRGGLYYRLRTAGVRGLRRVPGARALARALLADEIGGARTRAARRGAVPPMDIRPGRFFTGDRGRTLPVIAIVALGANPGDAEKLADTVERAQYLTGSFRPLLVVDGGELAPFRARGFAVEHVMSEAAFRALNPEDSYNEYVLHRVGSIVSDYRALAALPVPPDGGDPFQLRLIGAVHR